MQWNVRRPIFLRFVLTLGCQEYRSITTLQNATKRKLSKLPLIFKELMYVTVNNVSNYSNKTIMKLHPKQCSRNCFVIHHCLLDSISNSRLKLRAGLFIVVWAQGTDRGRHLENDQKSKYKTNRRRHCIKNFESNSLFLILCYLWNSTERDRYL